MDILKFVLILYCILLFPFMLGTLWQTYIVKRHLGMTTLVQGWLCMMALFYCEAVPMVLFRRNLSELKKMWVLTLLVLTALYLFLCIRTKAQRRKVVNLILKKWKFAIMPLILILCSILFVKPSIEDDTLEIVMETIGTDTMYQYQPFTSEVYEELPKEQAYAPLEMYYAVLFDIANTNPAIIVRIMIPIGFLPVVMLTYVLWAKRLFPGNRKGQGLFLIFAGIISFLPLICMDMSLLSIWQSCWIGEVMLATTVLPLVCYDVYMMVWDLSQQWRGRTCVECVLNLLAASLAAQLMDARGMLYSCLIVVAGVLVLVVRRWQKNYAANSKCR